MKINLPIPLINLIKSAGSPVYVVGGCVRNTLSGLTGSDIDLCGPLVATALNLPKGCKVRTVNFRLGTSIINYMGETYEYTPFRTEKYAEGGSHSPESIAFTNDIRQDAARRDFTVNSIYYDVINDNFIDFFGGIADCEKKILRSADPERIFSSDGLRILRLARIAAETGFKLDGATANVAIAHAEYLNDISKERIAVELDKILVADTKYGVPFAQYRGLKLLSKLKLLPYILPTLAICDGVPQNPVYHKFDVLEHTFATVKHAHPSVRLAALMHDTGKAYCYNLYGNVHGHEKISANNVINELGQNGLKYSNSVINETARLCAYHMYDLDGKTSEGKVRLFVANNFDIIDKLTLLMAADSLGTGLVASADASTHRFIKVKNQLLLQEAPLQISHLALDGNVLMGLGFSGAQIGDTLSAMLTECILNPALNNIEWLTQFAQKRLKKVGGK